MRESSPNLAASITQKVKVALEDGGLYQELIWDWAKAEGMDPQKLYDKAQALVAEAKAKRDEPRTPSKK